MKRNVLPSHDKAARAHGIDPLDPGRDWRWIVALLFALGLTLLGAIRWGYVIEEQLGLPVLFVWRGEVAPPPGALIVRVDRPSVDAFRTLPDDKTLWPESLQRCNARYGGLDGLATPINENDLPRGIYACALMLLEELGVGAAQFDVVFREAPQREAGTEALLKALADFPAVGLYNRADMGSRHEDGGFAVARNDPRIEAAGDGLASFAQLEGYAYRMFFWTRRDDLDVPIQLPVMAALLAARQDFDASARSQGIECASMHEQDLRAYGKLIADFGACLVAGVHHMVELPSETVARLDRLAEHFENQQALFFNYYGTAGHLPSISLAELTGVIDRPLPEIAPGSVAFIGHQNVDSPSNVDKSLAVYRHPAGIGFSGLEEAATAYLNIWHDDLTRAPSEPLRLGLSLLAVMGIVTAGSIGSPLIGMIAATVVLFLYMATVLAVFSFAGVWIPWLFAVVGWPAALLMAATHGYDRARGLLFRLVPSMFASEVLEKGDTGAEGHQVDATVLYCDLEGYSAITALFGEAAASDMIQHMFEGMDRNILAEDGFVHQLTGDGIIAYWIDQPNMASHALRACRCALRTADVMADVNKVFAQRFGRHLRMRVSLNAGPLRITMIGHGTMRLALVGDTINTGQRIEQLAKHVGEFEREVVTLVSQAVVDRLPANHGLNLVALGSQKIEKSSRRVIVYNLFVRTRRGIASGQMARP